jgi:hypothetical protein
VKFEVSSKIEISTEEIGAMLTMEGVNMELSPLVRMTAPVEWARQPIYDWPVGEKLFVSWILLFGIIPIDRHRFFFKSVDHLHGFVEESNSLSNKLWRHHRDISISGATCQITDTVDFQCRLPFLAYILAPVYRFVFRHRHRVLRSRYGESNS